MRHALIAAAFAATNLPYRREDTVPIRFLTCPVPRRVRTIAAKPTRARDGRGRFVKPAA